MFVLIDAIARTGRRADGYSSDDVRMLEANGCDVKDNIGGLVSFATKCKLALTDTFFSPS